MSRCPYCGLKYCERIDHKNERIAKLEEELRIQDEANDILTRRIAELEEDRKFWIWMAHPDNGFRNSVLMAREEYEAFGGDDG